VNLRHFKDLDDLFDSIESDVIFGWVNELNQIKARYEKLDAQDKKRREYHKVHQESRKLIVQAMHEQLDPDEIARLKKLAEERVAERGEA
jgi:hypothetical protein